MKKYLCICVTAGLMVISSQVVNAAPYDGARIKEEARMVINPFEDGGEYENMKIIFIGGGKTDTLLAEEVADWVRYSEDGKWYLDGEEKSAYIDHLKDLFNTTQYDKILDTTMGEQITITRVDYGWVMDREKEASELEELIRKNGLTVHEIHFSKTAQAGGDPHRDYGDSYIEIDLTRQMLWMYEEGRVSLISPIVSGMMNTDRQTPGGAFGIYYKQSPAVLVGADYQTPVSYWMPFNGGIGLHDATWQPDFGGDACYYRGSHGCINLPLNIAGAIYEKVYKGFPVLCYYSDQEDN